jgi:hypothetical protein
VSSFYLVTIDLRLRFLFVMQEYAPMPEAVPSKVLVSARSVAGIAVSNLAEGMDVCLVFICCVVLCR